MQSNQQASKQGPSMSVKFHFRVENPVRFLLRAQRVLNAWRRLQWFRVGNKDKEVGGPLCSSRRRSQKAHETGQLRGQGRDRGCHAGAAVKSQPFLRGTWPDCALAQGVRGRGKGSGPHPGAVRDPSPARLRCGMTPCITAQPGAPETRPLKKNGPEVAGPEG